MECLINLKVWRKNEIRPVGNEHDILGKCGGKEEYVKRNGVALLTPCCVNGCSPDTQTAFRARFGFCTPR